MPQASRPAPVNGLERTFFLGKIKFFQNDRLPRLTRYFGDRLCRQADFLVPLI
jgi:hypothetical protein